MTSKAKFNLDEYILDVCREANVKPEEDIFLDTDLGKAGFSISYYELLKCVAMLNRDPAFSNSAKAIINSQKKFFKFLESNKISEGLVPKPILVKYCDFINSIFKEGQFIADLSLSDKLQTDIEIAASSDLSVFLTGESGTGKELTANSIHKIGSRKNQPFIPINCAQYAQSDMLRSEIFGHTKGAFTGAIKDKRGAIEEAKDGTLFLDEIGDADIETQKRLLRFLNDKTFSPVGSTKLKRSNARIICATNRFDEPDIKSGKTNLRLDLFYRISQQIINLPPLRSHKASIPLIIYLTTEKIRKELKFNDTIEFPLKLTHKWIHDEKFEGNYRELVGLIEDWVRKYIYWKQNYLGESSVLRYAVDPQIETVKKNYRISPEHIELMNLAGLINEIDKIPLELLQFHNFDYFLEFPYLQWALFDLEKQKTMENPNDLKPKRRNVYLYKYTYKNYQKFTTVRPPQSTVLSQELNAPLSEDDKSRASNEASIDKRTKPQSLEEFDNVIYPTFALPILQDLLDKFTGKERDAIWARIKRLKKKLKK